MTVTIGIASYAVRVWDKEEYEYCQLDNLPTDPSDFFQIIKRYLEGRRVEKSIDSGKKSVMKVDRLEPAPRAYSIDGLFKAGTYGFSAELENLRTGVVRNRSINDCEYLPIYYNFQFKPGQNEAILLLQKFGVFGVKTTLLNDLAAFLNEMEPNLRIEINPLVSESQIKELIGGSIKRIRYLKYSVPDDIADDIEEFDNLEENAEMELVIKAKRDSFLGMPTWMSDVFRGRAATSKLIEINGIEYDNVKVEIDLGRKKKTLNISDIRKLRMNIDVTEDVKMASDGHPTFESMREQSEDILPELRNSLRWADDQ